MTTVAEWLERIGLGQYAGAFAENDIDMEVVPDLTDADLKELGLSLGHRRRLLAATNELRPAGVTGEPGSPDFPATALPRRGGAERRQLTVMFCDLVDSTAIAEQLDPEEFRQVIDAYQAAATTVVGRYGGHVAQYLGDGIMAYFGWPRAHEDDAQRAVRAALDVVRDVQALDLPVPLSARVGIASGIVVIGRTGSGSAAMPAAAVGETPNIAARLQAMAPPGGIVANERTRILTAGAFETEDAGPAAVKGLAHPIRIFRILGPRTSRTRFEASHVAGGVLPLVGREAEMALLRDRWHRAQAGEFQAVLVLGEAGIGKSRLVHALVDETDPVEHYVLRYQCSPFHTDTALFPIIDHFATGAGFDRSDTAEAKLDKLEELIRANGMSVAETTPLFADALSIPVGNRYPPLNLNPARQKEKIRDALIGRTMALAARKPMIAVFEDLHWCDASTLDLIDRSMDLVCDGRVLFLGTARAGFSPRWRNLARVTVLSLSRLGPRQAAEIVGEMARGTALPEQTQDEIVAKADGLPLFIEELTRSVLDCCLPGSFRAGGERNGEEPVIIPPTIHDSLMARLDRLGQSKEVAQVAAAIGRRFDHDLLAAVCDREPASLDEALDRLVDADIVLRRDDDHGASYQFKHALIQEAAYESLLKSARQSLHRQIAETLRDRFPDVAESSPEVLAFHFTRAGAAESAVEQWLLAGRRALHAAAYVEAAAHLQRGLDLVDSIPDRRLRVRRELELRMRLGPALAATSGWYAESAKRNYDRAHALSRQIGDVPEIFATLWGIWLFHAARGEARAAGPIAREMLALAESEGRRDLLLQAHHAGWANAVWAGAGVEALGHIAEGMALYETEERDGHASRFGGHDPGVCAKGVGAVALWLHGAIDQSRRTLAEGFVLARRLGHPPTTAHLLMYATLLHSMRREPDRVAEHAGTLVELAGAQGLRLYRELGEVFLGWTAVAGVGDETGLDRMRRALEAMQGGGGRLMHTHLTGLVADAQRRLGRPDLGLVELGRMPTLVEETGERWWEAEIHRIEGDLLLEVVEPDEASAEACYRRAIVVAEELGARTLALRAATSLAALLSSRGRADEGRSVLDPMLAQFDEGADTLDLREARAVLSAPPSTVQP